MSGRAIALLLALCTSACTRDPQASPQARARDARIDAFYLQASEHNWWIVGGSVFRRVQPGLPGHAIAKQPGVASGRLRLRDSHHFDSLVVSPDRERVAALSIPFGAPFEDAHLIVFDRNFTVLFEDRRETDVGHTGEHTRSPLRWSPDGQLLAYAQSGKVWVIEPSVGGRRSVAAGHQRALAFTAPSWCGAGTLVYESERSEIIELTLADSSRHLLGEGRFPSCSPDAKTIVFRKGDGKVVAYARDRGSETELFALPRHGSNYLWSPDSRYLMVDQRVHGSRLSNDFVYSFEDEALLDLGLRSDWLDDCSIEALPKWLEARLLPVE